MLRNSSEAALWKNLAQGRAFPRQGGSLYLLQLLNGVFLLAVDLLLLKGAGLQLPDPLFQAGHALLPHRGTVQQLPLLTLQPFHLLLQL